MAQINSIRQLFFEKGLGYAEIARVTGFDVKTVKKYVHMEDFNQPLPKPRQIRGSKLDKYKEQIDEWMVADKQERKKQRHTARRIFDRLVKECPGFDCSYRLVAAYVSRKKKEIYGDQDGFNRNRWTNWTGICTRRRWTSAKLISLTKTCVVQATI